MSKGIVVVTDSSAYLPVEVIRDLPIAVIPLWLMWDEKSYQDGIDIHPTEFYQRLKESKTLPTSSQPSAQEFSDFYKKIAQDADAIVNVLVSAQISGTIASAQAAMAEHSEMDIRLVDSNSSAMGLGLCVLAAGRAAAAGKSVDDVVAAASEMSQKIHLLFVVDTLEYLFKGGRISGGKRLLGTALNIKPILHFEDGKIKPHSQARTKRKALAQLLEIVEERLAGKQMYEACIMDVNTPDEGDSAAGMVRERFNPVILHRSGVSPVVGTHVGPGTVGIAFYAAD
jgi:DegV family protein with EDD domain